MTPNDYVNLVATELDDPGKVTFTQSDIEEALQNAYHYIAVLTGCFPKITSVNFPTSPYWKVDIPDYFSILLAYNPNSKRFIEIRDLSYLEALNDSWDTKFGHTSVITPLGANYLGLYPHYETVPASQLYLVYNSYPTTFKDEVTVQIPSQFKELLVYRAVSELLESVLEFSKARAYYTLYLELLPQFKKFVSSRIGPNLYRRMLENAVGL